MTQRARRQHARFQAAFTPAEQELRRVLGGSVDASRFYSCVSIIHNLAEQIARAK
jgi:hypothetical protein